MFAGFESGRVKTEKCAFVPFANVRERYGFLPRILPYLSGS